MLPLTLLACLLGGALALPWPPGEGRRLVLATLALTLLHGAGALLAGAGRWRLEHPPQPRAGSRLHGFVRILERPLARRALALPALAAGAGLAALLAGEAGTPALVLALAGVLLLATTAGPLRRLALAEGAVFVTWGPLMTSGVYWVVSGDWGPEIALLALLYGLGPALLMLAGHLDRRRDDAARRIRTLAVRLGPRRGPKWMLALAMLQCAGLAAWTIYTPAWPYALTLVALPALWTLARRALAQRPSARPRGYPTALWPLWYTPAALRYALTISAALVAAAVIDGAW